MCSKKKKKEGKYVHRIYLRRIILAALLTFCVIYFGSTVAMMMYFQGAHLDEFLTFSQLTLIHIRSQTVAELKQNEIQLVHSDLKSTAESIQDFISWDYEYVSTTPPSDMSSWQRRNYVDYFTNHQEEKLIKNVWTFFQDQSKRDKRNYDKALWYFAQASGDQIAN